MTERRRFPPPWQIEEREECFIIHDATGRPLGFFYFEDEPVRQRSTKRLTPDEAGRMAVNFAKLPDSLREDEVESAVKDIFE